jgi:hypothetical protein
MTVAQLEAWAQSQIDNTATPEVRPDIGVSVLQMTDELIRLQDHIKALEAKLGRLAVPQS